MAGYLAFIVMLIAYAAALCGLNPLFEFSNRPKMIILGQLAYLACSLGLMAILYQVLDQPLYHWVLTLSTRYPWLMILGAVALAGTGIFIFQRILRVQLMRKDFR